MPDHHTGKDSPIGRIAWLEIQHNGASADEHDPPAKDTCHQRGKLPRPDGCRARRVDEHEQAKPQEEESGNQPTLADDSAEYEISAPARCAGTAIEPPGCGQCERQHQVYDEPDVEAQRSNKKSIHVDQCGEKHGNREYPGSPDGDVEAMPLILEQEGSDGEGAKDI